MLELPISAGALTVVAGALLFSKVSVVVQMLRVLLIQSFPLDEIFQVVPTVFV